MKIYSNYRIIVLLFVFLLFGTCFIPASITRTINYSHNSYGVFDEGQILFSPMASLVTYLIDNTGTVNHTWSSNYYPGAGVRWLGDGTILRAIKTNMSETGGSGGGIQKMQWDGTITWDFRYDTNGHLSHHDIEPLPNGNVLMIAWETKTRSQAIAAGRNPNTIQNTFMPDHVIEVEPTGPTTGDIVWEWHVWDHLIQDFDDSKDNYGAVADHPELIDINFVTQVMIGDWLHTNSIDYNEEFDQILLSVHNFNEIWIIDHSTTTQEAVGHTGGNSGKGGDILYRWGNPQAYRAGTTSDQKFFSQHDASWIIPNRPGEGDILIFNNGVGRLYSSVDEIVPPVDNNGHYYLEPGSTYGPENLVWSYTGNPPSSFYAFYASGAERLLDGNTLICNGVTGEFFEVTPDKITVWQYTNNYPSPGLNDVFKIEYIPPQEPPEPEVPDLDCSGTLSWDNVEPGSTVTGNFQVGNVGEAGSLLNWEIESYPTDWGTWTFTPQSGDNLTPDAGPFTVNVEVVSPNEPNTKFQGEIRVVNKEDPEDYDVIPIYLKTPRERIINIPFLVYLKNHLNIFSIFEVLLKQIR
jgi:hypothetical protein